MIYVILTIILLLLYFFSCLIKSPKETISSIFKFFSYFNFKYRYYCIEFNYEGDFLDQQILPLLEDKIVKEIDNNLIKYVGTYSNEQVIIFKSFSPIVSYTYVATNYRFNNIKLQKTMKGRIC